MAVLIVVVAASGLAIGLLQLAGPEAPRRLHPHSVPSAPPGHHLPLGDFVIVQPGSAEAGLGQRTVEIVNAASGATVVRPILASQDGTFPWTVVGNVVVAVEGVSANGDQPSTGTAYAITPYGAVPPVALGPANAAVAAFGGRAVWLWTSSVTNAQLLYKQDSGVRCALEEVSVTGAVLQPSTTWSCSMPVVGAVSGGLLVNMNGRGTRLGVWSLSRHRVVRTIVGANPLTLSIGRRFLAWTTAAGVDPACTRTGACPIEVVDTTTGRKVEWRPPQGLAVLGWSLAPGSRSDIAVVAISRAAYERAARDRPFAVVPQEGTTPGRLFVVNGATGKVRLSRGIATAFSDEPTWAPDGSYVFVTRYVVPNQYKARVAAYPTWSVSASPSMITMSQLDFAVVAER